MTGTPDSVDYRASALTSRRCHLCGSTAAVGIADSYELTRVSSACLPLTMRPLLISCPSCSTLTTEVDDQWMDECTQIYRDYVVYPTSDGVEENVFNLDGGTRSRSTRLLELLPDISLETPRAWLDFGCGNGALLRVVTSSLPNCELFGVELGEANRGHAAAIPNVRECVSALSKLSRHTFDVISCVHTLEHIPDPRRLLLDLSLRLSSGGHLLIQVPSIRSNPYVLSVGDHASHFDLGSLTNLVLSAGLRIAFAAEDHVPGELTLIAKAPLDDLNSRRNPESPPQREGGLVPSVAQHSQLIRGMLDTEDWLRSASDSATTSALFGTSIAGTWAGSSIDMVHSVWVDEDPQRIGRTWLGKPIVSPSAVTRHTTVLLPLAPSKAQRVAARLTAPPYSLRVLLPPASI